MRAIQLSESEAGKSRKLCVRMGVPRYAGYWRKKKMWSQRNIHRLRYKKGAKSGLAFARSFDCMPAWLFTPKISHTFTSKKSTYELLCWTSQVFFSRVRWPIPTTRSQLSARIRRVEQTGVSRSVQPQTTDVNFGQARCLTSRSPTNSSCFQTRNQET